MTDPVWHGITISWSAVAGYGWNNTILTVDGTDYPLLQGYMVAGLAEMNDRLGLAAAALRATSSTSLAIGTGSKSLTIEPAKGFSAGDIVLVYRTADASYFMLAQVTSYDSATGALVLSVASGNTSGAGTFDAWTVRISGTRGPAGSDGANGSMAAQTVTALSTTGSITAAHAGQLLACTGDITRTFDASATITAGKVFDVKNVSGTTTLAFTGGEAADGHTELILRDGQAARLVSTTDGFLLAAGSTWSIKQTLSVLASGLIARTTNGATAVAASEASSNKNMLGPWLEFSASTKQYAQTPYFPLPASYTGGTIMARFAWDHPSTTTNFGVVWGAQAVSVGDGESRDAAPGTAQEAADTGGTTDRLYISPWTAAITPAGTPAAGERMQIQVYRDPDNGSDTMAVVARLQDVEILIPLHRAGHDGK